jgi:hypothetical protein
MNNAASVCAGAFSTSTRPSVADKPKNDDEDDFLEEFFQPRCCGTSDEDSVPPWTRGDFRGVFGHGN